MGIKLIRRKYYVEFPDAAIIGSDTFGILVGWEQDANDPGYFHIQRSVSYKYIHSRPTDGHCIDCLSNTGKCLGWTRGPCDCVFIMMITETRKHLCISYEGVQELDLIASNGRVVKNAKIDLLDSRKRELDSAHDTIVKMREEDAKLRAEITRLTQIIENIGKSPKTDTACFGLLEID